MNRIIAYHTNDPTPKRALCILSDIVPLLASWLIICLERHTKFHKYHNPVNYEEGGCPSHRISCTFWKRYSFGVWSNDSCCHFGCQCIKHICVVCGVVLKWHGRKELLLIASFATSWCFNRFPQFHSSWHLVAMFISSTYSSMDNIALSLSAGCSGGHLDYRGIRMCMAELLGRAAKM